VAEFTLFGLELHPAPEQDDLVASAIVIVEVIDGAGVRRLGLSSSKPMSAWQMLGMLQAVVLATEVDLRDAWQDDT
jgi:hypothetical protein